MYLTSNFNQFIHQNLCVFCVYFYQFFRHKLNEKTNISLIFFKIILYLIKEVLYLTTNKREMNKQYTYTNFWFFYFSDKSWD